MLLKALYDTARHSGASSWHRWIYTLLLCAAGMWCLSVNAGAAAPETAEAEPGSDAPVILVVGDSLSAEYGLERGTGWVSLLQERLEKEGFPHRVHNASISGDTTSGGASRLPTLLDSIRPAVVIIELGGNDALRGLPLHLSRDNLRRMIQASLEFDARVVITGMQIPPNYGATYARQFEQLFQEVAANEGVTLVPFLLEGLGLDETYFQADRIHPNEAAQPIMLSNVWPVLQEVLTDTSTQKDAHQPAPAPASTPALAPEPALEPAPAPAPARNS